MDTELLFTVTTKGTYYYPASNKYLVNKKDYDSVKYMVCEINNRRNLSYTYTRICKF
jgi:capsular polysaccharide biosynthesis protein